MSPVPSLIVAKQSFPPMRDSMTRPATPTRWPVAVSGSRSGCFARISAIVAVRGKPTG